MRTSISRLFLVLAIFALNVSCGGSSRSSAVKKAEQAPAAPPSYGSVPSAAAGAPDSYEDKDVDAASAPTSAPSAIPMRSSAPAGGQPPIPPQTQPKNQRAAKPVPTASRPRNLMLIYTANLTLAVFEAVKGLDEVEKMAIEAGGYLVRRTDTSITVRIPAEGFRTSLEAISKIGDELHRDVSVRDVTAEFRDLETQLKNLTAVRDRLQALLARAKNVPEALQVEQQLTRVTGQIEQIKGRMKLYRELVAFSTINVNFSARPTEKLSSTIKLPFPWLEELGLSHLYSL